MRRIVWLVLIVTLLCIGQASAQETWICRINNASMNGWRPLMAQSPQAGAPCIVPTNLGDVYGVQQYITGPLPPMLGSGPLPVTPRGVPLRPSLPEGMPGIPVPSSPYNGNPNQRNQDMMKLATCSGSGDAWTFIGCFAGQTIQQECFEEGDCLDDAKEVIKDIGYTVADIFGW